MCNDYLLASAAVVAYTADKAVSEAAEQNYQQQEKEQKAVINAIFPITEHIVIPP
jgi:hypothetical protein